MSSPALSSPGEDGEHGDMQNFVPTALMNTTQASNKFQLKIAAVNKKRIREVLHVYIYVYVR